MAIIVSQLLFLCKAGALLTLRAHRAILAIQVLAQLFNEGQQLQLVGLQPCPAISSSLATLIAL